MGNDGKLDLYRQVATIVGALFQVLAGAIVPIAAIAGDTPSLVGPVDYAFRDRAVGQRWGWRSVSGGLSTSRRSRCGLCSDLGKQGRAVAGPSCLRRGGIVGVGGGGGQPVRRISAHHRRGATLCRTLGDSHH